MFTSITYVSRERQFQELPRIFIAGELEMIDEIVELLCIQGFNSFLQYISYLCEFSNWYIV